MNCIYLFILSQDFFFPHLFSISADVSHTQLGRRGVWDSAHHASTWDGVWSGPVGGRLALPRHAGAAGPAQGGPDPPVPPSEPGPALHHHLTQHAGPGWDARQQRPAGGTCVLFRTRELLPAFDSFHQSSAALSDPVVSSCQARCECKPGLSTSLWLITFSHFPKVFPFILFIQVNIVPLYFVRVSVTQFTFLLPGGETYWVCQLQIKTFKKNQTPRQPWSDFYFYFIHKPLNIE